MKAHHALELLGTIWWMGAFLGHVEGFEKPVIVGIVVGTLYFLRALCAYEIKP